MNNFYRFIFLIDRLYYIIKNGENYGGYKRLEDALYERDSLITVDWDWDLSMELPETQNPYEQINLPPFHHNPTHITVDNECWVVRGTGREQKYYGRFLSEEEAIKVARLHNANVSHKNKAYMVQKRIDGRTRYFGRYKTLSEAQERVKQLEKTEWRK